MNTSYHVHKLALLVPTALIAFSGFASANVVATLQVQDTTVRDSSNVHLLPTITVTATRTAKTVFEAPQPVLVIDREKILETHPNSVTELFRTEPGLDVNGVGGNQARPSIRGLRGQRILLLVDGMRLSNSRRQQDFGELPALVEVSGIERVEVVRGPASVLYGSDAIGGVVNMITRLPDTDGIHGSAGYRYSTQTGQHKTIGRLLGRFGSFSFTGGGSFSNTDGHTAPAGTFGDISLDSDTEVFDTSHEDISVDAYVAFDLSADQRVFGKLEYYNADTAGFGWVDPAVFEPGAPTIQIRYPYQRFHKVSIGYDGSGLQTGLADRFSAVAYYQKNERELSNDIFIPFGAPDMGLQVNTLNYTDIATFGMRLEATKLTLGRVLLTYGADLFRDATDNTDFSVNTYVGFPQAPQFAPDTSDSPRVPNATYRSIGTFLQGDIALTSRLSLILGGRFQDIRAKTRETPGLNEPIVTHNNRAIVGAANAVFAVTDQLSLVGTIGRAFRAPNLIEQFFEGSTPEGSGYQSRNPDLEPEKSFNVDIGARLSTERARVEGFVFRNLITDGIRIVPTGDSVGAFFEVVNDNVDKLRIMGVEFNVEVDLPAGFSVGSHLTYLDSKDVSPQLPEESDDVRLGVGDSYSSKVGARLRYEHPTGRFFAEYEIRRNGSRRDAFCPLDTPEDCDASSDYADLRPAVGWVLPAFTVHNARVGVDVIRAGSHVHRIAASVANLTNTLYAEFSNASFFRPEAKRGLTVSWNTEF